MAKISDLIKFLEDIKEKNGDLEILRDITYLVYDVEDLGDLCYLESAKKMTSINSFANFSEPTKNETPSSV